MEIGYFLFLSRIIGFWRELGIKMYGVYGLLVSGYVLMFVILVFNYGFNSIIVLWKVWES